MRITFVIPEYYFRAILARKSEERFGMVIHVAREEGRVKEKAMASWWGLTR
jgi:hypothetical protein